MKRLFLKTLPALVLAAGVLTMSACGGAAADVTEDPAVSQTQVTEAVQDAAFEFTPELEEKLDEVLRQNNFTGVVQLTYHGEPVYTSASGTNDLGQPRTMEDAMYLGSISKQFCAVAILILRDEGKLNLDDTLDKYFPEYSLGKDITIQNLLTMRSGIVRDCDIMGQDPLYYFSQTKEENIASFKEWVFAQPLQFTPGTELFYSNVNYTLLSLIVEAVSGQEYDDFIRQRILEPVGMEHTGFIRQIKDAPQWAEGLSMGIAAEKQETYLKVIMEEAEKMDKMVLSMLDLSRLEAGRVHLNWETVCLMDMAKEVFEKLKPFYEEKNLTVHFLGETFDVLADRNRMEQLITNLATNAVKYCTPAGSILVKVHQLEDQTWFSMENDCYRLPQKALDQIWDSFFREDSARGTKGTGLGLAIVKSIVELHNGSCRAVNTDSGLELQITLPR